MVGAHLRAESGDRPLAYRLRDVMLSWCENHSDHEAPFDVLVCSDVWCMNNDDLLRLPTVSIGGPGVNALTANLADKTPSAFVIENELIVQVDLDFYDLRAAVWGMSHSSTIRAVEAFIEKYLDLYLTEVSRVIEQNRP